MIQHTFPSSLHDSRTSHRLRHGVSCNHSHHIWSPYWDPRSDMQHRGCFMMYLYWMNFQTFQFPTRCVLYGLLGCSFTGFTAWVNFNFSRLVPKRIWAVRTLKRLPLFHDWTHFFRGGNWIVFFEDGKIKLKIELLEYFTMTSIFPTFFYMPPKPPIFFWFNCF